MREASRGRLGHLSVVIAACVGLTAGLALPQLSSATSAPSAEDATVVIAKYQGRIPELMAEQDIPGLAVALVDGDHVRLRPASRSLCSWLRGI